MVVPAGANRSDARDYRYVVERWEESEKLRVRKYRGCLLRIGIWNFPQDDGHYHLDGHTMLISIWTGLCVNAGQRSADRQNELMRCRWGYQDRA